MEYNGGDLDFLLFNNIFMWVETGNNLSVEKHKTKASELQSKAIEWKAKSVADRESSKASLDAEIVSALWEIDKDIKTEAVKNDPETKKQLEAVKVQLEGMKKEVDPTFFQTTTGKVVAVGGGILWLRGFWKLFSGGKKDEKESEKEHADEKKETSKEKTESFWKSGRGKFLMWTGIGTAAYYVSHGVYTENWGLSDFFDWEKGKKLTMEEAVYYVKGNVLSKASEDHLTNNIRLKRDEANKKLSAFGQEFEIDVEKRKIKGLDITFKNFEDLITTALIIGSAKDTFVGACPNDTPFSISSLGGDIEVKLSEGSKDLVSGKWFPIGAVTGGVLGATLGGVIGYYAGIKAGVMSGVGLWAIGAGAGSLLLDNNDTLSQICPTLNKDGNKKRLVSYLNSLWGRVQGSVENLDERAATTNEKANKQFVDTLDKIQATENPNDDEEHRLGNERNPSIKNYANHSDVFELTARWKPCYLQATFDNSGKIRSVQVEDTWVVFSGENAVSEALHLALFITQTEKKWAGKGDQKDPFTYSSRGGLWFNKWIYFDVDNQVLDERLLSKDAITNNMPTLLQENHMDTFIKRMNTRESSWQSLWTNKTWSGRKNTYLKKLSS